MVVDQKHKILKSVFGFDTFRALQEDCIDSVLAKRDTVLIMPTGGGKSLCFQIPALMFDGLTIVISPLISLMKDQVYQLKALGVEAEVLNSSLDWEEYCANKQAVEAGRTKLLFMAPETLFKEDILNMLDNCPIDCITVDEAHCISEWGHDFRPEYRKLKDIRERYPQAVFLAVTATATTRVRKDIVKNLELRDSLELLASFNRDNLFYEVMDKTRATDQTIDFLQGYNGQSGIIYCFSRKGVDQLTHDLIKYGFKALPYHAGLSADERNTNQEAFIRDDVDIMVATIAFGMGINKPNVRFVIHYDLPKNIESYYQQIGRAGRDGLPSHCLLIFSPGDSAKLRYFIDQITDQQQRIIAIDHLNHMMDYAETRKCRRIPLLSYFGEKTETKNCGLCDNCANPPEPTIDLTKEAVQFFQCISELDMPFGATHIINVLRGSQSEKILSYYHHEASVHGAGKHFSMRQWQFLARQFVTQRIIDKEQKYGCLTLNEQSFHILSGKIPFEGYPPPEEKPKVKSRPKSRIGRTMSHNDLFEKLRLKRKEIADAKGVPPYVIFSDKTLVDMCARMPRSQEEFKDVFGVGEQKLKKYGEIFLKLLK